MEKLGGTTMFRKIFSRNGLWSDPYLHSIEKFQIEIDIRGHNAPA